MLVVNDVVKIQSQFCWHILHHLIRFIVLVLELHHLVLQLEKHGDVEKERENNRGQNVGHDAASRAVGDF